MSVILILILASLAVALVFLGGFIWAVRSGQFEDTVTPSMRVLMDERGVAISDARASNSRRTILPLPAGEGRGEGGSYEVNPTNDSPQHGQT
jgi:cbb3-type cytochrome oxidase maturation protein